MISILASFLFISILNGQVGDEDRMTSSWPDAGPPLLFEISGLGNGYSSPTISSDRIYITGEIDQIGYLYAFSKTGKLLWKVPYGEEWTFSYPGSRAAPIIANELIYICSGKGELSCFEAKRGNIKWSLNIINDLGGINVTYGYAMPLLLDGEKLYCSPGGKDNNIVALNRFTGKVIWSSSAKGETAGYGAPMLLGLNQRKILVTSSEFFILGLDAASGELLWSYELDFKGALPCNTPVFDGKTLYWIAGPGNGAVAAELSSNGNSLKVLWKNIDFDTFFGGFVKIGNYLYGASEKLRKYVSVDSETGKIVNNLPFNVGSIITSDNMLIAYNQKGQVGLIRTEKYKLELLNTFRITSGSNEHFSHPVIFERQLYIRHGGTLFVYGI